MIQIQQLNSARNITFEQQKQIRGGDAEDHWRDYSAGKLDIGKIIQSFDYYNAKTKTNKLTRQNIHPNSTVFLLDLPPDESLAFHH